MTFALTPKTLIAISVSMLFLAAVFGIAALFGKATLVLAPLAILLSLVALCLRQFSWALIGASTAIVALVTSIWFWTLLGLGWIAAWLVSYLI